MLIGMKYGAFLVVGDWSEPDGYSHHHLHEAIALALASTRPNSCARKTERRLAERLSKRSDRPVIIPLEVVTHIAPALEAYVQAHPRRVGENVHGRSVVYSAHRLLKACREALRQSMPVHVEWDD